MNKNESKNGQSHDEEPLHHMEMPERTPQCGFGSCEPSWIQKWHTPRVLLVVMIMQNIAIGLLMATSVSTLTTLERRFGLSASQIGLFSSIRKGLVVLFIIPIAHYANKGHKGRWIAGSMICLGVGSLIIVSTEFIGEPYHVPVKQISNNESNSVLCHLSDVDNIEYNTSDAVNVRSFLSGSLTLPFIILVIGQAVEGFGGIAISAVSRIYIDENVTQNASPMYIALYRSIGSIGMMIGMGLSYLYLTLWHNFLFVDWTTLDLKDANDPRWVGAWWLGYLLSSTAIILTAIPLFAFARELPSAKHAREKAVPTVHATVVNMHIKDKFANIPKQLKLLLKIPFFTLYLCLSIVFAMIFGAMRTFYQKVLEHFFNLSPRQATAALGLLFGPGFMVALIVGGYIVRKCRFTVRQNMYFILATSLIGFLGPFLYFLRCEPPQYVGVNLPYLPNDKANGVLHSSCNAHCGCNEQFKPVCNKQLDRTYYSPCFAGCSELIAAGNNVTYFHCSCPNAYMNESGNLDIHLHEGTCAEPYCTNFYLFFILFSFISFIRILDGPSKTQLEMRIIPAELRALSSATRRTITSVASVPSTIIGGFILDTQCEMWNTNNRGQGYCVRYDNVHLGYVLSGMIMLMTLLDMIATILNLYWYKEPTIDRQATTSGELREELLNGGESTKRKITHVTTEKPEFWGSVALQEDIIDKNSTEITRQQQLLDDEMLEKTAILNRAIMKEV